MLTFKKKIVTDEAMRPVAVLIDYQDWQKIEQLLKTYQLPQIEEFNLYFLGSRLGNPLLSAQYFISVITEMELLSYPSLIIFL